MSPTKKRIKTISGITKPTMSKILGFAFRHDFHECKIDPKTNSFIAFISQSVPEEKEDDFVDYWKDEGVKIAFLRVADRQRSRS